MKLTSWQATTFLIGEYLDQAKSLGVDLEDMIRRGLLEMVYVRPLDLSMDETLYAIQSAIDKVGAQRVALHSISGLEAALAPAFKEDCCSAISSSTANCDHSSR